MEGEEKAYHVESKTSWCWRLILLLSTALVASAATLTLLRNFKHSSRVSGRPGPVVQKYADALELATQFFDTQKCIHQFPQTDFSKVAIFFGLLLTFVIVVRCSWEAGEEPGPVERGFGAPRWE